MKQILNRLFEKQQLNRTESRDILVRMANGEYNHSQIAAFLTVFLMRQVTVEELSGFRDALLDLCVPFDLEGETAIDLCGTGGDGKNTFNISTLSSFVVAGSGNKVVKHGNYGVSSICGSSNVLEHLGYAFTNDESVLKKQLEKSNICFLHAPLFHPAMKAVAPIRRELGVKTFFNMLGPLVNPAKPSHQLSGVFNLQLGRLYPYLLKECRKNFAIVHSIDGYDEISLTGEYVLIDKEGMQLLRPENNKLNRLEESAIYGGLTVAANAEIFLSVLDNNCTIEQKEVVLANSATAIHCIHREKSFADCLAIARESIDSGAARESFNKLVA